jgi:hypothetical protein
MFRPRVFTLMFLALAVGLGPPASVYAQKTLTPIEQVGSAGSNVATDSTFAACDSVAGCFDNNGDKCSDRPGEICGLAIVPEGRCTRGTGPCIWPQGAGSCTDDGSNPHAPLVPCLPDNPADRSATSGLFASSLCPGSGQCDMAGNDPSCECQGSDPTASDWEGIVCSLNPNQTRQLYCSDGEKNSNGDLVGHLPPPAVSIGGPGLALCTNISLLTTEAGASFSNCGYASNFPGIVDTPLYASPETPATVFTPQRKPGTGLSLPTSAIQAPRISSVMEIDDVGSGDFAAFGIRRVKFLSDGYYPGASYGSGQTNDSGLDNSINTFYCDPPAGWATHQPIRGTCTDAVTACVADAQCPTSHTCDPATMKFCNTFGVDLEGLVFTRDITTTELSAAGTLGICPPDCGTMSDFHVFETEAQLQVGTPIDTADSRAGVQMAFDNLEGPRAGRGDFLGVTSTTSITWLTADPRCYFGGDPYILEGCNPCTDDPNSSLGCCAPIGIGTTTGDARCSPVSAPAGDAQCATKVGRCALDRRPCDPLIGGSSECGSGNACNFCGGIYDGSLGTYVDCPSCADPVNGNPQALPPGYDSHGFSELDLVAHHRISIFNTELSAVRNPLFFLWTNTAATAEFFDSTCDADGAGNDRCQLGESDGGDTGIGTGGSFTTAQKPTFDPSGPNFGYNVSWGPEDQGTIISVQPVNDVGPGPDGIPACIGDNTSLGYKSPCDQRLGNALDPGSTGTDDVPVLADFSVAQDGSDMRPATIAQFKVSDPFASAPVINFVGAIGERDLDILGLTDNLDIGVKYNLTWCPIVGSAPDCTLQEFCAERGGDLDGDGICNDDDSDVDGDAVLDTADNCVLVANPAASYPGTRTTTGGQLDDDADGYGNLCDGKFTLGPIVTALDTIQYKGAINKPILASNCGSPATKPCDQFDLDGVSPVITALDTIRFKAMLNKPVGPKCAACPLACVGDACP